MSLCNSGYKQQSSSGPKWKPNQWQSECNPNYKSTSIAWSGGKTRTSHLIRLIRRHNQNNSAIWTSQVPAQAMTTRTLGVLTDQLCPWLGLDLLDRMNYQSCAWLDEQWTTRCALIANLVPDEHLTSAVPFYVCIDPRGSHDDDQVGGILGVPLKPEQDDLLPSTEGGRCADWLRSDSNCLLNSISLENACAEIICGSPLDWWTTSVLDIISGLPLDRNESPIIEWDWRESWWKPNQWQSECNPNYKSTSNAWSGGTTRTSEINSTRLFRRCKKETSIRLISNIQHTL